MALSLLTTPCGFAPALSVSSPAAAARSTAPAMETLADLKTLASELHPVVGYWVRAALFLSLAAS